MIRPAACSLGLILFFFFNDTATTEIYTLSLHDALPICVVHAQAFGRRPRGAARPERRCERVDDGDRKSTRLELQSRLHLVCRLLLEKKKKTTPPACTSPMAHARVNPAAGKQRSCTPRMT